MNTDLRRLARWLRRAQPPRQSLAKALALGVVASASSVALFAGAIALLVVSATRPGLRAVAGVLIAIELLAFLRSPIRFGERLSAHQLGFSAVTRWRRWLVMTIGRWDYGRWRAYAAGDLLERSLRDTDELQDLWLRSVVPLISTAASMLLGDVVVGLLAPHGGWWPLAGVLALVQLAGAFALLAMFPAQVRADRSLRGARAGYQSTLVELGAVAPDAALLGADDFVRLRSGAARAALARAERAARRSRRGAHAVAPVVSLAGLGALTALRPVASPTWLVVAALVAIAAYDAFDTLRAALETAVAVSAAAQRLEELELPPRASNAPWPDDTTLRADGVTLREEGRVLVDGATFEVAPGHRVAITGPSGTGKSSLLRALAALDVADEGVASVGGTALGTINEQDLRRHMVYLPSEPGLTRGFVDDVVRLGRPSGRNPVADLARLALTVEATTRWQDLSRGERQRIAVVRALVTEPDVYLLDEPTGALGRDETARVLELLASTGATVLVATHDPDVMDWCDEVLELRDGVLSSISR